MSLAAGPALATEPLSTLMREGSKAEHTSAENSGFMTELLQGRGSVASYAVFLRQLAAVYDTLESVGRELAATAPGAAVVDPAIERSDAIARDLEHLVGDAWRDLPVGLAAATYTARIRATLADPVRYVAHHYTRYLGDLSGGQAIGRILQRDYGLVDGGTAFYAFPAVPKPKLYKDAYRARLDALDLDADAKARVVDEVRTAFALNEGVFAEMATLR